MKFSSPLALIGTVWSFAAMGAPGCALADSSEAFRGTTYYFDWHIIGNAQVAPVQIFDDGQHEWIQFTDPTRIPAIFADTPGGQLLLSWTYQPPYVVINHPESVLLFRVGRRIAKAVRSMRNGPPEAVVSGLAQPVKITGFAREPLTQDELQMRRQRLDAMAANASEITSPNGAAIHDTPADPLHLVSLSQTMTSPPSKGARFVELTSFSLKQSDATVAQAFRKWGEKTGWTILWDTEIVAPITGDSTVNGSLAQAVFDVLMGLRQAGYPLWVSHADPIHRSFRVFQTQSNASFSEIKR